MIKVCNFVCRVTEGDYSRENLLVIDGKPETEWLCQGGEEEMNYSWLVNRARSKGKELPLDNCMRLCTYQIFLQNLPIFIEGSFECAKYSVMGNLREITNQTSFIADWKSLFNLAGVILRYSETKCSAKCLS